MEKKSRCCNKELTGGYNCTGCGRILTKDSEIIFTPTTDEGKADLQQIVNSKGEVLHHISTPPESWETTLATLISRICNVCIMAESATNVKAKVLESSDEIVKMINRLLAQTLSTETEKYKQAIKILEKEIDDMARDWDKDLSTEKARWMNEWREKIEGKYRKLIESTDERTVWRQGYNQALDDIIKLIKDDGTSN